VSDTPDSGSPEDLTMPLGDHLEELRARILRCILLVVVLFIASWFFREPIMRVLVRPHATAMAAHQLDTTLKFRSYLEPITAYLKACVIVALLLAAPLLLHQMWAFVAPGLYKHEQRVLLRLGFVSLICFAAGVAFGYFLFIPLALRFLLALSGPLTEPVLMIGPYLSLFVLMTLALGAVFQTPLIMYHLVRWDIVSVEAIQKHRKSAILAGFILAAVFTPPDPFTQIMMAVPLIMLYDLGALAAAPSKRALANFARFGATVLVLMALVVGFFLLWPVGVLNIMEGEAALGSRTLRTGESVRLHHGTSVLTAQGALARVTVGGGKQPRLLIEGKAPLQAHGTGTFSLYEGRALIVNPAGRVLEVRTPAARVTVERGTADLALADGGTLQVTVLEGEATVRTGGRSVLITAGHAATFHRGGEPADVGDIERHWRQRFPSTEH